MESKREYVPGVYWVSYLEKARFEGKPLPRLYRLEILSHFEGEDPLPCYRTNYLPTWSKRFEVSVFRSDLDRLDLYDSHEAAANDLTDELWRWVTEQRGRLLTIENEMRRAIRVTSFEITREGDDGKD